MAVPPTLADSHLRPTPRGKAALLASVLCAWSCQATSVTTSAPKNAIADEPAFTTPSPSAVDSSARGPNAQEPNAPKPDVQEPEEPKPPAQEPGAADPTAAPTDDAPTGDPHTSAPPPEQPAPQDPALPGAPYPELPTAGDSLAVHGTFSAQLRGRSSGSAHDLDAYGLLAFDVGTSGVDPVTGRFLARLSADLDGQGNAHSQAVFGSLQDVDGEAVVLDLYEASAEFLHPFEAPLSVRVGRQLDYDTPEAAHFDGLSAESEAIGGSKFVTGAYGGVPVRIYEGESIANRIFGAWGELQPWTGGRLRADWMYVHQEEDVRDFNDDLLALSLWQRLGTHVGLDGGYTWLDQESRDLRLRATWDDGEGDFMVQLGWYRLLTVQRDYADEFDPYFTTLLELQPFDQYRLLVSKALGDHFHLDVGGDIRRLEEADTESQFNHDYERGYVTGVVTEVTDLDLALSLTADSWNSDDRDIQTWGLDVTWEAEHAWRLSAGSAFALYKFDVSEGIERDDVRVWYTRVRREVSEALALDLAFEFEDDSYDDYGQFLAGATWRF